MNAKLIVTIKKEVIEKAKQYAKDKNCSLSDIIENYLKILTMIERQQSDKAFHPIVTSLKGSFKPSKKIDYKKELEKRLEEKYL